MKNTAAIICFIFISFTESPDYSNKWINPKNGIDTTKIQQSSKISRSVFVRDSLDALLKTAFDTSRVIVLNKLSFQYLRISSYEKALLYSKEAFELSDKLFYMKGQAKSLINTGNVFLAKSDFERAEKYYLEALDVATQIKNFLIVSHCTNNLGEVYRQKGQYEKALHYYFKSLRAMPFDKEGEAETLNNIGLVHREMGNFDKAIECYTKALKISRTLSNKYDESANLLNLANAYSAMGDLQKALNNFEQALILKEAIGDRVGIGSVLVGIGNIYWERNKLEKALDYFKRALEHGKALEDKGLISACLNNIGGIHSQNEHFEEGIKYRKDFLAVALETGANNDIRIAYNNLAVDYSKLGDFETAFKYYNLYSAVNDSIFNFESSKQIAEMQTKYESEKKETEIEVLKQEQFLQSQINLKQKLLFAGVVVIILMGSLIVYFHGQANKQKSILLAERLEAQNRELLMIGLLVNKKNRTFSDLKNKLEVASNEEIRGVAIKSVIKDIDKEIDFDEEWNTFKYHVEKVHPEFFSKLKKVAPTMSNAELRLCVHLKTTLSTKEIATLTNSTVRSVQQAKYRINQKLSTHHEGNLSEYLNKL